MMKTITRKERKLSTSEINSVVVEIVKQYPSNTAAKAAKKDIAKAFDLSDRETIECLKAANALRLENLTKQISKAREVFSYERWLNAGFEILKKDVDFQRLFAIAEARKATTDDLTTFCKKYYIAVSENGQFLKPVYAYRFVDGVLARCKYFTTFDARTASDAVKVLQSSFLGFTKSLKYSATGRGGAFLNFKPTRQMVAFDIYDKDKKAFTPSTTELNIEAFDLSRTEAFEALAAASEK